jgi:hypothetical protein
MDTLRDPAVRDTRLAEFETLVAIHRRVVSLYQDKGAHEIAPEK